jgi:hypothetical protein
MTTPAPVTAQQRAAMLQSAQIFEDGVNDMKQVYSQVFSAGDQLKGQAMVSQAGSLFANAVSEWVGDFNNIINLLGAMHDQLLATSSQTVSTDQANAEIAAALAFTPSF